MKDKYIIKCPYCGAEYTPAEIYIPDDFFVSDTVLKDEKYKIISADSLLNTTEEYCCDHCLKNFKISADVSFTTETVKDDFEDDSVVVINKDRVNLE